MSQYTKISEKAANTSENKHKYSNFRSIVITIKTNKGKIMKNISKLLAGILFSALVISPSYAGEMAVTGGATATYTIGGDSAGAGKGIGISNELDFTASGELDNGYTWKYQVQLDGASTANDDTRLEIGTDMGTLGIYVSEGGLSKELSSVGALGAGFDYMSPAAGTGNFTGGAFKTGYDVDGFANIQYHLPSGVLPFGMGVKVGYVPDMNDTGMQSAKDNNSLPGTHATGRNLTQLQVTAAPIDGLSIQGDIAETKNATGSTGADDGISANLGAVYTMGQLSVSYIEGGFQPAVGTDAQGTVTYENKFIAAQFDVNDSLAVSYHVDESLRSTRSGIAAGNSTSTKTDIEMEQESLQLAYTTGGATIGIAQNETDNSDYTSGRKETQSVVSLAISF